MYALGFPAINPTLWGDEVNIICVIHMIIDNTYYTLISFPKTGQCTLGIYQSPYGVEW